MLASKGHKKITETSCTDTSCDSKLVMDTAVAIEICFQENDLLSPRYINNTAGEICGTKTRKCKVTERDL